MIPAPLPLLLLLPALLPLLAFPLIAADPPKSKIAVVENPALLTRFDPDADAVQAAVATLLTTLTDQTNATDAWKSLGINSDDLVAIKITTRGESRTSTRRELTDAVTASLLAAGLKPGQITIYDKREVDMARSGYKIVNSPDKIQVRAIIASASSDIPGLGFDPATTPYFNPTMGQLIYGDLKFQPALLDGLSSTPSAGSADRTPYWSYYTTVITQKTTKLINLGTMTSDPDLGIFGCCASLAFGSVDNTRRLIKPNADQDTTVGEILISDPLKPKTVLHIADGLILQFAGGKDFDANYATTPGLLLASTDPVALDTLALARFEKLRLNPGPGVPPIPKVGNVPHLAGAALVGAGTTDPKNMQILSPKPPK